MQLSTCVITVFWCEYNLINEGHTHFVPAKGHLIHMNNIKILWKLKIDALKFHIKNYMVNRIFDIRNSMENFCFIINILR